MCLRYLGYVLSNYRVNVTIIDHFDRALPNEDPEVSKEITRQYKKLGIDILTDTRVESITDRGAIGIHEYMRTNTTHIYSIGAS